MKKTLFTLGVLLGMSPFVTAQSVVSLQTTPRGLSVASAPSREPAQPAGYYDTRVYRVWVPAERIVYVDQRGYQITRILPGRYEYRQVQVWVPLKTTRRQASTPVPERPGYMHPMNTWRARP